jgi:HSP20 family molecular chaperone IbpA
MRPMLVERPWGPFERRFVLPTGSRVGEMKARYVNGVLEIAIPVDPVELPKEQKIEIA